VSTISSFQAKLLSSSGLMLGVKLLGAAAGYALAWWVSRHEGAAAYGRFELALTVLTIGALAARLGLDGVLVKWLAATSVQGRMRLQRRLVVRALVVSVGVASVVSGLLMAGLDDRLTGWLGDPGMAGLWPAVAAHIPVMAFWGMAAEGLRGLSRMRSYALLQPGMVMAGAVALLMLGDMNVMQAYVWSLAASALVGVVLLATALPRAPHSAVDATAGHTHAEGAGEAGDGYGWRAMFSTGWPMLLSSAMFLVMSWTDTLLVGHFLKEDQVGLYRVAFRMAAVVTLVQAAVNSYAAPLFAERHASGDRAGLRAALRQTTLLNVAFSIPAFGVLVAAPTWWMGWFGEAFVAGATCLVWLAAGQVVNALCGPVMYLLNMTGHERPAQRIVWVAALVNLGLNLWAIPRFGIEGAAVATALSMALWNVAAAVAVKKLLGLSVWAALRTSKQVAE
jgi:O-antigen/teichoic acid export membrane protein